MSVKDYPLSLSTVSFAGPQRTAHLLGLLRAFSMQMGNRRRRFHERLTCACAWWPSWGGRPACMTASHPRQSTCRNPCTAPPRIVLPTIGAQGLADGASSTQRWDTLIPQVRAMLAPVWDSVAPRMPSAHCKTDLPQSKAFFIGNSQQVFQQK